MPGPGCVTCASGEVQCGSDTSELCGASGGWSPAGAICLQFFLKKHPKTGNCMIKVEMTPTAECGAVSVVKKKPTRKPDK